MLSLLPVVVEYGHNFNEKVVNDLTEEVAGCRNLIEIALGQVSTLNREVDALNRQVTTQCDTGSLAPPVPEDSDDDVKGKGKNKGKVIKGKGKSKQKGKYRGWMERTAALVIAVPFDSTSRFFLILVRHV